MLDGDSKGGISNYLNNFSSVLKINIDHIYTDNIFYLTSFGGNLKLGISNIGGNPTAGINWSTSLG